MSSSPAEDRVGVGADCPAVEECDVVRNGGGFESHRLAIFSLVDSSTPEFRTRVAAAQKLVIDAFEQIVRWAMQEGLDPETDVEMRARALFALFWDAGRLVLAEPETFPAERITSFGRRVIQRHLEPR